MNELFVVPQLEQMGFGFHRGTSTQLDVKRGLGTRTSKRRAIRRPDADHRLGGAAPAEPRLRAFTRRASIDAPCRLSRCCHVHVGRCSGGSSSRVLTDDENRRRGVAHEVVCDVVQ
jgi:hypothetical protein